MESELSTLMNPETQIIFCVKKCYKFAYIYFTFWVLLHEWNAFDDNALQNDDMTYSLLCKFTLQICKQLITHVYSN